MDTETHQTTVRHDWTQSDEPCVTLIEAVAAATNRAVTNLPILHESIDPDALETLLTQGQSSVTVSFRYADTSVRVSTNGILEIQVEETPAEGD